MRLKRKRDSVPYVDPPSNSWIYDQLKRIPELKRRVPTRVEANRVEACGRANVAKWFADVDNQVSPSGLVIPEYSMRMFHADSILGQLSKTRKTNVRMHNLLRFQKELTFNMDETSISAVDGRLTVIVPKQYKRAPTKELPHYNHHITIIMCVAASGDTPPVPTAILPLDTLPAMSPEVLRSYNWSGSDTGFITMDIWESWIVDVFIPHVCRIRDQLHAKGSLDPVRIGQALLYCDGHSSRLSARAHDELNQNGVICIAIPAHTSHILQPLDCGINNILKTRLKSSKFLECIDQTSGLAEYRHSVLYATLAALHDAYNPFGVSAAFNTCGLYPWRPEIVLENPCKVTPSETIPTLPERPTGTQLISGRVISPDDVRKYRADRDAEAQKKVEAKALRASDQLERARQRELAKTEAETKKLAREQAKAANRRQ